ncbi:MAG: NAD(P)H-quinone oxidoreductase [Mesorhizobium amorphae]|nr:MAG: NAD(P)H-quinone oxidoreductase [Mesorhizobium amorphae]
MLAVSIARPGGPEVLVPGEHPVPQPRPGEILVRVHAAGVNRPDVQQRKGAYPPPPGASPLPGLEVSGEVAAIGEGTERWRVGDRVCALTNGGGYAEYVAVHGSHALAIPHGFTFEQAAALPETFFTVWHNVFERGALRPGEWLLVHGGSSGIGTTATQLATVLGARVIVTVGSTEKARACLALGAERAVNYREEDFVAAVKETTEGHGADLILDMVGGDYVSRNYHAAAEEGRIVQIATQGGAVASADFARLMMKRLTHTGSTLRPRSTEFKGAVARMLESRVWPLLSDGRLGPVMDQQFPLKVAAKAHARMEEGDHIGKIVLVVA